MEPLIKDYSNITDAELERVLLLCMQTRNQAITVIKKKRRKKVCKSLPDFAYINISKASSTNPMLFKRAHSVGDLKLQNGLGYAGLVGPNLQQSPLILKKQKMTNRTPANAEVSVLPTYETGITDEKFATIGGDVSGYISDIAFASGCNMSAQTSDEPSKDQNISVIPEEIVLSDSDENTEYASPNLLHDADEYPEAGINSGITTKNVSSGCHLSRHSPIKIPLVEEIDLTESNRHDIELVTLSDEEQEPLICNSNYIPSSAQQEWRHDFSNSEHQYNITSDPWELIDILSESDDDTEERCNNWVNSEQQHDINDYCLEEVSICSDNEDDSVEMCSKFTGSRQENDLKVNEDSVTIVSEDDTVITEELLLSNIPQDRQSVVICQDGKDVANRCSQSAWKCAVCWKSLTAGQELSSTLCGHIFCTICIHTVLKNTKKCPKCVQKLTIEDIHKIFV